MSQDLIEQFGNIDIYLFDQLMRGRISAGMRLLDAGCGVGRNLVYFLRSGYDVSAIDQDPASIAEVCRLAASLAPNLKSSQFQVATIEAMPHPDRSFDCVISNAVLHFAATERQFESMLKAMWRVVRPGGMLFCRLASSIGIETLAQQIEGRRYLLPDGSERYLVDAALLKRFTKELGAQLLDPIKTTVVQDQRSMTTWVLRKNA